MKLIKPASESLCLAVALELALMGCITDTSPTSSQMDTTQSPATKKGGRWASTATTATDVASTTDVAVPNGNSAAIHNVAAKTDISRTITETFGSIGGLIAVQ